MAQSTYTPYNADSWVSFSAWHSPFDSLFMSFWQFVTVVGIVSGDVLMLVRVGVCRRVRFKLNLRNRRGIV